MATFRAPKPYDVLPTQYELARDFGYWLQQTRNLRGLKQAELADLLCISKRLIQSDISQIECGKRSVDFETLVGLCHALKVKPSEFQNMVLIFAKYL